MSAIWVFSPGHFKSFLSEYQQILYSHYAESICFIFLLVSLLFCQLHVINYFYTIYILKKCYLLKHIFC